jgi:hypothetical protein
MSEERPTRREDQEVELLSTVNLFESLSKEEIRVLIRQNSEVLLGEGETFYAPWDNDPKLFILKKGQMRLYRTEGGREFTLEVADAGTVFGEMAFTPPPPEGVLRQGHRALRHIRDGACRGGAADRGEAPGRHQDDKPPLRAPALLRDEDGRHNAKGGASEAC